jgi:hypothetical protein
MISFSVSPQAGFVSHYLCFFFAVLHLAPLDWWCGLQMLVLFALYAPFAEL